MISSQDLKNFYESNKHLVSLKSSIEYPNFFVVKYKNKVFYDNLWSPELQEMRGLVVDHNWNAIVRPFTKIFNRGERGTDIDLDEEVIAVQKINGFMAAVTPTVDYGVIVSTTGSLDSDFAKLAKSCIPTGVLESFNNISKNLNLWRTGIAEESHFTYLFEICHKSDPHIIEEVEGVYLIGARNVQTGDLLPEHQLDLIAANMTNVMRPMWTVSKFGDVVKNSKNCNHEGFVVYGKQTALKIKSPYYLTKKFFARVSSKKLTSQWLIENKSNFDEEFYPLVDYVASNVLKFSSLNEEQRKKYIEDFLKK